MNDIRISKRHRLARCLCIGILCFFFSPESSQANEIPVSVFDFLTRYCIQCHDSKKEGGGRSFDSLLTTSQASQNILSLEEIVEQLNLGEMPPLGKNILQPPDLVRSQVVADLTAYLLAQRENQRPATTVLRRLTRYEYKRTIGDLLAVDTEAFDATASFPADSKVDGFANIGSEQQLSEQQLQLYMDAGRRYLDEALVFGKPKPKTHLLKFIPRDFTHSLFEDVRVIYRVLAKDGSHLDIGHGEPVERYPTYPQDFSEQGVSVSGRYLIRIKAAGVGRQHPYDPSLFKADLSMPLKIGLWHVPDKPLLAAGASEGRVFVEAFDLLDDTPSWLESTVWMPAGSIPFVHWINGEGSSKPLLSKIQPRYHPETKVLTPVEIDALREKGEVITEAELQTNAHLSDVYQGPRVRLYEMTIEGPLVDQWPPESHQRVVGDSLDATAIDIPKVMTAFACKAFRRPLIGDDIAHYIRFVQQRIEAGVAHEEAIKLGLTAILASPRFLFFDEGNSDQDAWLDDFELASRLSYFLWSSMPDDALLKLASQGELRQPARLLVQTERLLRNDRSHAFTRHFIDAWLRLDKLGSMPPSTAQFPKFYFHRLEPAMATETRMFFDFVLSENRPLSDFIDAPYTFVNDALADLYGIDGAFGETFQKVTLPPAVRRGGLLGHASVLTASANGVETSPVVRGVWVLESLLGIPPSTPPADVPPLEPDTRGATTIREQLAKHRSSTACGECHAKIDPWGFALEYFDPIGGFRDRYTIFAGRGRVARRREGKPVDGTSVLASGESISNEADLRNQLLARKNQFTRNLAKTLLTYASGRELTFADRAEIETITQTVADGGYGFRDLVLEVVASESFRRR